MEIQDEPDARGSVWRRIRNGVFDTFVGMLKDRKVGRIRATVLMGTNFLQIYGTLVTNCEFIEWQDNIVGDSVVEFFKILRLVPVLLRYNSAGLYWLFWSLVCFIIVLIMASFSYTIYRSAKGQQSPSWLLETLNIVFLLLYWLLYNPALELFMSTFLCRDSHHLIDAAVSCKGWLQILLISLALFFAFLLAGLAVLSALLYRQSHPDPEDALAETENPLILGMILYRTFVFVMGTFEEKYFGVFIVKYVVMIMMSALFIWQYIKYFPYFDSYMSVLYGYCLFMHAWVIIVSLMTYIVPFSGHLVMFLTGILPVFLVVFNIRSRLIYELTVTQPDQINSELAAIMQCYSINMLISSKIPPDQEIVLTGMIYFHEKECKDKDCPIHLLNELYDASMGKLASDENTENLRKNQVYLKHYVKLYYTIAVSKFESSPGIRIAYAFFLFFTLRNVHTSLTELAHAKKLNPNITQNFEIYKFEKHFESYMNNKLQLQRQNFYNLNYVIDFENLLTDFTVSMQKVSEAQYNFWCHLQDPLVLDYNQLDKDSKRIYERVKKTEELWKKLYEINPEYEVSVNRYVDYLRNIRNNDNLANNIVNQLNTNRSKRTLETIVLNNTLLFDPKTAILQISGSKDSLGRIVRTNQGTLNLFSYTAIELLQNSVNKIIPNIFARKHHAFMENYFATGHTRILDKKRSLFALHKNGCCFQIMLFVRPIFNHSSDALQYIGMLSSTQSDAEYILTDMNGVIDSMSQGIMAKLRLKPKLLHRFSGVNVQVLAPDLMYSYQDGNSSRGQKYKKVGGDVMLLVVPTNVRKILHDVSGSQTKKMSSKFVDMSIEQIYANLFGKSRKQITTPAEIYQSREYLASTLKVRVNCEIRDMVFSLGRNRSYSVRALKLTGVRTSHEELEAEGSLNCDSGSDFNFRSSQLVEEVKLFSAGGEEGMSKVLESTQRDQLDSFRNLINEMSERKDLLGQMSEQPKAREESKEPQRKNTEKGRQKEENSETLSRANDNESVAGTHKQHVEDSKKAAIYEVNDIEMGESLVIPRTKTKHEKETLTNLMMQQLKDARNRQKLASIATAEDEGNEEENKEVDEAQREMEELMDEALEQKVENNEEGSVSSVSTSVYDATQANYSIRNAVDEKKVPESTRNMNYMTIFMFLLLLGLAIAYYTVEMVSYRRINNDIEIITYSEDRKSALIDLNINVKLLLLIDPRYRECSFSCYDINIEGIDNSSNIQQINEEIVRAGKSLARAQSQLSIKTSSDSEKLGQKINPSNVELSCIFSNEEMPTSYNYDIWQATLELLSAALRISNMTVDQKYSNYSSMYLINENSLNSVLSSLDYSTDEIVDIIKDTRTSNMRIYLIMLIVASVATLVSTAVLIPVTKIVKKTNEKVLSFFLLLDDAEIKQYRYTCERFAQLCKNVFILISNR